MTEPPPPQQHRKASVDDLTPPICRAGRRALNLTFEEMSRKTGGKVHPAAIKEYEADRNPLTQDARTALAQAIEATGLAIFRPTVTLRERVMALVNVIAFYWLWASLLYMAWRCFPHSGA